MLPAAVAVCWTFHRWERQRSRPVGLQGRRGRSSQRSDELPGPSALPTNRLPASLGDRAAVLPALHRPRANPGADGQPRRRMTRTPSRRDLAPWTSHRPDVRVLGALPRAGPPAFEVGAASAGCGGSSPLQPDRCPIRPRSSLAASPSTSRQGLYDRLEAMGLQARQLLLGANDQVRERDGR